ncbi:MAG: hypothetical protein ACI8ZN_001534 [Bacteroidia bacterium]|jgi:hypothetical protein
MNKVKYFLLTLLASGILLSEAQVDLSKSNKSNSWLKIGINTALPIVDLGKTHSVGLGFDGSVQFLETKASVGG